MHKGLRTVPGRLDASLPGVPQLLSQIPMTDLPNLRCESFNTSQHGNSAKGHGSFCLNGTSESLATCSFLKSHYVLTSSGVRCTVNSENIIPTLLSESYKQHVRRWETPRKLCGTMFPTLTSNAYR